MLPHLKWTEVRIDRENVNELERGKDVGRGKKSLKSEICACVCVNDSKFSKRRICSTSEIRVGSQVSHISLDVNHVSTDFWQNYVLFFTFLTDDRFLIDRFFGDLQKVTLVRFQS